MSQSPAPKDSKLNTAFIQEDDNDVEPDDSKLNTAFIQEDDDKRGGRRKGKKTRKVNPALKSWVKFVKKIQHEEKLTYPEAMKRASKRKSEWQRGGATDDDDSNTYSEEQEGGRRRRRHSRRQRGGNAPASAHASAPASVADFDSDWKQYGKVGGSRKRRSRRHRR
jgi:hypothetical protein